MIAHPVRQNALRSHQHPAQLTGRTVTSLDQHARLAGRLTARDKWIVRMLHEHRVLTTSHITALAFPSQRAAEQRLLELFRCGVVSRFRPATATGSAPMYYVLGPTGARVLAAEHGLDVKDLGYRHDREQGRAHAMTLAHTVGVNDWFAALVADARRHPGNDRTVRVWWSEHRCARHFGDLVKPDAYGHWHTDGGGIEFFLEFDCGTEALGVVAAKLDRYAHLATSTGITTPILVWLPTARREAAARRLLARAWQGLDEPARVPVATAATDLLDPESPHASPAEPVWLPLGTVRSGARGNQGGLRCALVRLRDVWPDLEPPASAAPVQDQPLTVEAGRTLLPPVPPMAPPPEIGGRGASTRWTSRPPSPDSPPTT